MKHYIYGLYTKNTAEPRLFYIGITSGNNNLYYREKNHRREDHNPHKLAIIKKYDFDLRVLWEVDSRQEAEDREEFLIRWLDNLCNICSSANDLSHARLKPRKPKSQWKKHSNEDRKANRDRNLTMPYEKVISLIEEWAQNPFETQQSFANRKNISRSKFKDWLRLYKPEYVGLQKKKLEEVIKQVQQEQKNIDTVKGVINRIVELTGMNYTRAKSAYYKKLKNDKISNTKS